MKKIILTKIGSRILVGSVLSAGMAGALWTIADLRIFGMTTTKTQAQGHVENPLVNSMRDYQKLRSLRTVADSQLTHEPGCLTEVVKRQ